MTRRTDATPPCPLHDHHDLSYLASATDAQERMKRGEKQLCCLGCGRWIWESRYYLRNEPTP